MKSNAEIIEVPKSSFLKIARDPEKTAKIIQLNYVNDSMPGIRREKKGDTFQYYFNNEKITDEKILERIKKLVIPPAWQNVWICKSDHGHLQATGVDAKGRKQYRYHAWWNKMRSETKYFRLREFGNTLPAIRAQLEKDIAMAGMPMEKVLAAIVKIMERTTIRVGNSFYEKLYGSFGLTTLKNKHVSVTGAQIKFAFKGKKGVQHSINLKSRRLSKILKKCLDIPGKELFQYIDHEGNIQPIDSGMVNEYIRRISGADFSSKDFRTWEGTLHALLAFKNSEACETERDKKHKTTEVLDYVAKHLGNTRTVCKKYYVHPRIIELFETDALINYFKNLNGDTVFPDADLSDEEKILLKILSTDNNKTKVIQL